MTEIAPPDPFVVRADPDSGFWFHGEWIPDPYEWLERFDDSEVMGWIEEQEARLSDEGTRDRDVPVSPFHAKLKDADGNSYSATLAGCRPILPSVRVAKGASIDIPVLQAASDPDGDMLTVIAVNHTGPLTINNVTINADNTVHYESVHGMFGQDYLEYTVSDGHGGTATGTVAVYVFEAPPPPP